MTSKTMWTIVATITIAFVILVTSTSANETKTINNKVNQFIVEEKNEIVEYQKENWQKGKEQIAQNKKQISDFWIKAWRLVRLYTTAQ
jgi:low affinity Fe/Cu permease